MIYLERRNVSDWFFTATERHGELDGEHMLLSSTIAFVWRLNQAKKVRKTKHDAAVPSWVLRLKPSHKTLTSLPSM